MRYDVLVEIRIFRIEGGGGRAEMGSCVGFDVVDQTIEIGLYGMNETRAQQQRQDTSGLSDPPDRPWRSHRIFSLTLSTCSQDDM